MNITELEEYYQVRLYYDNISWYRSIMILACLLDDYIPNIIYKYIVKHEYLAALIFGGFSNMTIW